MSEKRYGTKSEKQKAYRERKKNLSGGEKVAPSSERHVAHDPTQNNLPVLVDRATLTNDLPEARSRDASSSVKGDLSDTGVSLPDVREREAKELEAAKQEVLQNSPEQKTQGKGGARSSGKKWEGSETRQVRVLSGAGSKAQPPRTPSELRKSTGSDVAMSPVPRNRTFARDLVLAESDNATINKSESVSGEARESTIPINPSGVEQSLHNKVESDSRDGQNFLPNPAYETASHEFQVYDARIVTYDKKKYPNRQAWEIAVQRVERAIRYADIFPHLIGSDDLKFQTLDWQYENEGLKASTS